MSTYDQLVEKWSPVLNEESAGKIADAHKRAVTAQILENQEIAMQEQAGEQQSLMEYGTSVGGNSVANWNPVLIALVRRAMPNLMAYDVCGVQPMTGPTGLIFAMRARYSDDNAEALFSEADTIYSGDSNGTQSASPSGLAGLTDADGNQSIEDSVSGPTFAGGMSTQNAENLGLGGSSINEMGFTIEKATVTAKSRALKAEYTIELAQDLKAIHGLDAETELANILSTEILAEINREVVRTINSQAILGAQQSEIGVKGIFNLASDADGRWSVEKYKGLMVHLEREANVIAKTTRRGKGNIMICSSDVATALSAAGMLDYTPALSSSLQVDDTGNTFAGVLNGRMKVYIDPYASADYVTVGYKGTNPYDAGVFYCPYVPLQMFRAVAEDTFQPKIGFKTRYGMVSNPYADVGNMADRDGLATAKTNQYYRIFRVDNILTEA